MTLRPFWRYYGGKWRAALRYPAPLYTTIVEPFAGAAGYSLRYPDRRVILVERYAVVAEMWRWLIAASPAEVLRVPCVEAVADLPGWVPAGDRALVGFSMNSAITSPRSELSAGWRSLASQGRKRVGWSAAQRDLVASQVAAIKHWRIIEGDYTAAPPIAATWYVDPPYSGRAGSHYVHGSGALDFDALALWCRGLVGQTIVCETAGASWLPFVPMGESKAGPGRAPSREAVWCN